jgi:hypothetical protein
MRSTTVKEKARIAAGAVTAVVMTAVLFAIATGFLLARQVDEMPDRNQRRASLVLDPCGSGKKTETSFCW